jgi:putative glutamine amidotransferase
VLAICMGQQLINVVYGGTLIQHIETEIQHTRVEPGLDRFHSVTVEEDSLLHRILGARELEVNSSHHQAVDRLAPGLRVLARAPDGIVEAVQMTDKRFFIGVQWHPERLMDRPEQQQLFEAFVAAASDC